MTGKYAAGQGQGDGEEAEKSFVSLNWVLSEELFGVETQLEWGFLDYLLLGTSASPLRKVAPLVGPWRCTGEGSAGASNHAANWLVAADR